MSEREWVPRDEWEQWLAEEGILEPVEMEVYEKLQMLRYDAQSFVVLRNLIEEEHAEDFDPEWDEDLLCIADMIAEDGTCKLISLEEFKRLIGE